MIPYRYKAELVRVVDGDTLRLVVDLGFHVKHEMAVRLSRLNAPEMKDPGGVQAKDWLIERLPRTFEIQTLKDRADKYGRYLVEVYLGARCVNDWMLEERVAVPYMG